MSSTSSLTPGFVAAFCRLGETLLGTVHDRLELLATELHEEKFRVIQTFIWISAMIFTGMMALAFASITLVYIFWESARLTVLGCLTGGYITALGLMVVGFRRHVAGHPRPFAATLAELQQDRACIRPEN